MATQNESLDEAVAWYRPTAEVAALLDHLDGAGEDGRGRRYAKVASGAVLDDSLLA